MSTNLLSLSDTRAALASIGGKGLSLAKLAQAGFPIPNGFHITTDAYCAFIESNGLQPRILALLKDVDPALPSALETASISISRLFAESKIPTDIASVITEAYTDLTRQAKIENRKSVAVRSSATAEDLPEASFAGQQETYLNIRGEDQLLDAVKKCWASLWTARAIAYRANQGIDPDTVALAVLVQEMVDAEFSGILFTANPITGHRDEMIINAAWGLGEAIVSGRVSPDTITAEKVTGKVKQYDVAKKTVRTVTAESGTREETLKGWQRRSKVMKEAQIRELVSIARRIESFYGSPQDIEFCFAQNRFFIVQSRPITAMPPEPLEWIIPVKGAVLARGSFAEFVPEPVSPLFATLAVPIAQKTTCELMGSIGVTDENSYVFAVLNDYVYVGFIFSPKMTWQMIKASFQLLGPIIRTAEQRARESRDKFLSVVQKWQVRDVTSLTPSELLQGTCEIFTETSLYYNMAQSGTIPTSMMTEVVFGWVYKKLMKHKDDPAPETFLFGTENHAMRADKALWDIAVWIKTQPALMKYLSGASADEIGTVFHAKHKPNPELAEFSERFGTYLREYGHAIYDLDFAKPTPAEDPTPLLETLKVYLAGRNDPYERQRNELELSERAAVKIIKRLDPLRRRWFVKLLKSAQDKAPMRENSIADLGLGHPQIRRMLGEFGRRLAEAEAIPVASDIYWLEEYELNSLATLLENDEPLPHFAGEIAARKAKWESMRHIVPPTTLPKIGWMNKFFPSNEQAGNMLKGFAASAGKVTARACVMLGPEDFSKMHTGDVIVAGITTPAWTPLFARASAIVTDIGGPLSHSSIVAREYGIPAVLATGVGTRRIHDGDLITVDGSEGRVMLN